MKIICEVHRMGRIEYHQAWQIQDQFAGEIAAGRRPPTLLLLEHPHTYTFGSRGHVENLLFSQAELEQRGIALHWVDRGGDVTYHGPGQLVGYPLIPLGLPRLASDGSSRVPQADYVGYVRKLEQVLIHTLARFDLAGKQIAGLTGVWVQPAAGRPPEKIAAIGVKVDAHGITRHGFALNIDTDPAYWAGIVGCGLKDSAVTTIKAQTGSTPSLESVEAEIVRCFGDVFGYEMKDTGQTA